MTRAVLEHKDGLLAVECWCHHDIVYVSAAELIGGYTQSCGRERCEQIDARKRREVP